MKKYKVISLAVSALGKKIVRSGDEVTEKDFAPGNAEVLAKQGHLEEIKSKSKGNDIDMDVLVTKFNSMELEMVKTLNRGEMLALKKEFELETDDNKDVTLLAALVSYKQNLEEED